MERIDVIVIGGSQAGLCMSYHLRQRRIAHVVLERGEPGQRWKHERWDSLRLLTPNWQNRLPGDMSPELDPDGYLSSKQFGERLDAYARHIQAPLLAGVEVKKVSKVGESFCVTTSDKSYLAQAVVVATGQCARPRIPKLSVKLPPQIRQLHTMDYRRPSALPVGGVLVVGSSASGLQLAEEIHDSGRPVTLAVGAHTRMPRTYRGQDIMTWLERAGILGDCAADVSNIGEKRHNPSLQLLGSSTRRDINLETAAQKGVQIAGSLKGISKNGEVSFFPDLERNVHDSRLRLRRVLRRIDDYIEEHQLDAPTTPIAELRLPTPVTRLSLENADIRSVIWATGYRADLPFLPSSAKTGDGDALHESGHAPLDGLYFLGMNFLLHRNSSAIFGVGQDAEKLSAVVERRLNSGESHAA